MQKSNNILDSARIVTRYYVTYSVIFKCNWLERTPELYNLSIDFHSAFTWAGN